MSRTAPSFIKTRRSSIAAAALNRMSGNGLNDRDARRARLLLSIKELEARGIHVHYETTPWFIIDPRPGSRAARWLNAWDGVSMAALLFTALFTPFEVSFLPATPVDDPLFMINRCVDAVFACDMVVQFFLMYQDQEMGWVKDLRKIARRYLGSWFVIDLVSVGIAGLDIFTAVEETGSSSSLGRLELLRMFRVLRLVKLVRLARASKVLQRWQTSLNIDYATVALFRCVIGVLLTTHWSACVWALQVTFTDKPLWNTWMGDDGYCVPAVLALPNASDVAPAAWRDAQRFADTAYGQDLSTWVEGPSTFASADPWLCVPPMHMYSAAVYWAVMTITSIGYGDMSATPRNPVEQWFAIMAMLVGGLMWGYVIATFAGLLATMSPTVTEYRVTIDNLNHYMSRYQVAQRRSNASNLPVIGTGRVALLPLTRLR